MFLQLDGKNKTKFMCYEIVYTKVEKMGEA